MIISYADLQTALAWSPYNRAMAVRDIHGKEQVIIVWKTNHDEYILYFFEENTLVEETPFTNNEREEEKQVATMNNDRAAFEKANRANEFRLEEEIRENHLDPLEKRWIPQG